MHPRSAVLKMALPAVILVLAGMVVGGVLLKIYLANTIQIDASQPVGSYSYCKYLAPAADENGSRSPIDATEGSGADVTTDAEGILYWVRCENSDFLIRYGSLPVSTGTGIPTEWLLSASNLTLDN